MKTAKFTADGGHEFQKKEATRILQIGKVYEIEDANVGREYSSVKVLGKWYNSVLFDVSVSDLMIWFPQSFEIFKPKLKRY